MLVLTVRRILPNVLKMNLGYRLPNLQKTIWEMIPIPDKKYRIIYFCKLLFPIDGKVIYYRNGNRTPLSTKKGKSQ